ncbi:MAG: hypothetical protein RIR48_134 [Bacteroidota bacterium]|jgi:hypothetical protein
MEVWKDVIGYEGYYQVSNLGRIKSLERKRIGLKDQKIRIYKELILKQKLNIHGYFEVCLYLKNSSKYHKSHRIICQAFLPNPENKPQVNHKNGVKTDNRLENLEWATSSENTKHSFDNGFQKPSLGEKNGHSILNEKDVLMIRSGQLKMTQRQMASFFNVKPSTINCIIKRRNWKHI